MSKEDKTTYEKMVERINLIDSRLATLGNNQDDFFEIRSDLIVLMRWIKLQELKAKMLFEEGL